LEKINNLPLNKPFYLKPPLPCKGGFFMEQTTVLLINYFCITAKVLQFAVK